MQTRPTKRRSASARCFPDPDAGSYTALQDELVIEVAALQGRAQQSPAMNPEMYAAYMEEIKQRSEAITTALRALDKPTNGEREYMRAEFAFLQLRYICELVALSSLAAHHSIGLGSRLSKVWNAAEAFALLEHVNPYCFPASIRKVPDSLGVRNFHVVEGPATFKRTDLAKVYAACGAVLHRGIIKDALDGGRREYRLDDLNRWHGELMELLKQHMILIRDPDRTLLVNFETDTGRVAVYAAEAVEPEDLPTETPRILDEL